MAGGIDLDDALADIAGAPEGPATAAFFDFDGTIIDGYSVLAVLQDRARHLDIAPAEVVRLVLAGVGAARGDGGFPVVMKAAVRELAGRRRADLDELGARLLKGKLGGTLYPEAWRLVAAHRARGHIVVIASSALPFQVEPLAAELGIDHVLCTRLAQSDGVITGDVDGPILWGPGKAGRGEGLFRRQQHRAGRQLRLRQRRRGYRFSLGRRAAPSGQRQQRPDPRRQGAGLADDALRIAARPRLTNVARTVAAYGALASALGAGLGVGLVNRSRRDAVNLTISLGSEAALGLAGIRVDVRGEEHLWERRPAIFIFNHQSRLDGLIIKNLLRSDVAEVTTNEVPTAPVLERLAEGCSIAIAPEGTRSSTPKVGAFKEGAFRLAMQAGVPIVPIVIRNAGELLWRGSTFLRSGTLDVVVLPPISVEDWSDENLGQRLTETRALFLRTLAAWPS